MTDTQLDHLIKHAFARPIISDERLHRLTAAVHRQIETSQRSAQGAIILYDGLKQFWTRFLLPVPAAALLGLCAAPNIFPKFSQTTSVVWAAYSSYPWAGL
jgi:hypothetical protein